MAPNPNLPVHLLVGEEALLRQRAEEALINAALPEGRSGFNFSAFRAGENSASAVSQARTVPMLVRRRVVVIRDMQNANVQLLNDLLEYIASPVESTLLILVGAKLPPSSGGKDLGARLRNRIKKIGAVRVFKPGSVRAEDFVADYARQNGCRMKGRAVDLLVAMVGRDLGQLQGELDKLICYVGGRGEIGADAIEAVSSLIAEADIWGLTNALVQRNPDRALAAAHRLLEDGRTSHNLLPMVTWQFRELLMLQESMQRGQGLPKSWIRKPRDVRNHAQRVLKERPLRAHHVLNALSEANHAFNRSRAGDRRVFEVLILTLATH